MTDPRVVRGRRTQQVAADYLAANGFDGVSVPAAFDGGSDIRGIWRDGWRLGRPIFPDQADDSCDVEVKATAAVPLLAALAQSRRRAPDAALNLVIWRPNGYGEARVREWVVAMTLEQAAALMSDAGWETA